METLSLSDGTSRFELELLQWDGDAYVSVMVDARGYVGRNDLYIAGSEFIAFCAGLLEVQRTLKGSATLSSISPAELEVHIRPADSLGHFEVVGSAGHHVYIGHTTYWHAVHFGFQIDPNQLDLAARVPWVREHRVGA